MKFVHTEILSRENLIASTASGNCKFGQCECRWQILKMQVSLVVQELKIQRATAGELQPEVTSWMASTALACVHVSLMYMIFKCSLL